MRVCVCVCVCVCDMTIDTDRHIYTCDLCICYVTLCYDCLFELNSVVNVLTLHTVCLSVCLSVSEITASSVTEMTSRGNR